jgi:hypothetical protein
MSPCRYGNDINKTIHFEKNWKNVARKLQRFCSVYFPGVKKYCRLCSVQFNTRKVQTISVTMTLKSGVIKICNVKTVSENVVLAYLMEKSKTVKSSTLWSTYSMLKLTLNIRDGIDVTKFLKLVPFLKKKSVGYQAKKSKVLTRDQINLFLEKVSDENYLSWKVNIKSCYDKLYNLPFFRSF